VEIIVKNAAISTLVLAVVSTLGDWIWATYLPRHRMTAGLVHGALLCLAMGAVLGQPARRAPAGAAAGIVVGLAAAAFFYVLAPVMGMAAMLPAWFALWVMLAAAGRQLGAIRERWTVAVTRGVIAGVASGAAFYAVSSMWTEWDPNNMNYVNHLARWAFAFAPGFMALQAKIKTQNPIPNSQGA
jgi:hypothetical protein